MAGVLMGLVSDDTWEHNGEKLTYTDGWRIGERKSSISQDCATFLSNGWNDIQCSLAQSFLCEVEN